MRNNLEELFDRFSKDIEAVSFNRKKYYYFCGDDSTDNYQHKFLLRNKRILLFKNMKDLITYTKNVKFIFDSRSTFQFINRLSRYEENDVINWLNNFTTIDITLLKKQIGSNKLNFNREFHSIVFDYIYLLKEYFWQINSRKNYRTIKSSLFETYMDDIIFSKRIDAKLNHSLGKILNHKMFIRFVKESENYFEIFEIV